MQTLTVKVLIDLPSAHPYHLATVAALRHAAERTGLSTEARVIRTDSIGDGDEIATMGSAIVVGPGSPYDNEEAVYAVVRSARERGVPLVGTWGGFQHVLVEHARSLAGMDDASHGEYGDRGTAVITLLACSLQDQMITVALTPGSRLAAMYGRDQATELTTCAYGLDPAVQHIADQYGMRVAGTDETGEVRAIERVDHPFFVGTLYQPQLSSTPSNPHPVFVGLLKAMDSGAWWHPNWHLHADTLWHAVTLRDTAAS